MNLEIVHIIGAIFGSVVMGSFFGISVYFYAKKKHFKKLGKRGFFSCLIANILLGMYLSIPVFLIFIFLIYRKTKKQDQS
ncbi:hypothetical protein [Bacillus sp. AFS096315]|uniref:hypothetical protein n=1 Tax=Bacillus sp. AFS096315 TaxID=2033517 RepID=UPI000BEDC9F3|nr:hypothetical protein [Bacillus sp. AFS096315]PEC50243.1 hypothetical protein CON00_07155 [Bacillus sp. AFS096315]